jgi:hypothetical protein
LKGARSGTALYYSKQLESVLQGDISGPVHKSRQERQSCRRSKTLAQKKAKIGRPKQQKGQEQGKIVPIRFAIDELKDMMAEAKASNQSLSEWIRRTVRTRQWQ